ncbi:hypothetical protein BHE74_00021237 [Ensete ventricosum]|nr:hypothetical protein BHE74_00021237 [Ensete ventricosum]
MGTMAAGRRTLVLVNLAAILERADEALLPAVYKEVGAALHVSPTRLGSLTLFRSIVQSSCYPLAAYMAGRHNRTHVIALGAFLWATATFLVALSNTYLQVPFGWLQLTGNIGSILGGCFSLLLASTTFMGIAGWRIAFHVVGIISVVVGLLIRIFAVDPHFSADVKPADEFLTRKSVKEEVKYMLDEAKAVIKIPSFRIIVAQGVAGSFPWSALLFAPMWLELIGYSHNQTGILMSMFIIASSLGGPLGGKMGDCLATYFPNSGRIIFSQITSGSAIPFAALLMFLLPDDPSAELGHALLMFVTGLSISLSGPATNRARMNLLIASEMQQMELDDDHEMLGESSGLQLSEMELGAEERSVIDIAYGGEDFETDTDERALLSHKVD